MTTAVTEHIDLFRERFVRITREVGRRIVGHEDVVSSTVTSLLAGGHVLLEGIPGVGKTSLVHTLADVLDLKFSRIQFTPDLMPADIVGTNVIQENAHGGGTFFEFQEGPVFANVVLADEINRATPKTQSALLEAMQDVSVSVGKTTYRLDQPFLVLATQKSSARRRPATYPSTGWPTRPRSSRCGGWPGRCPLPSPSRPTRFASRSGLTRTRRMRPRWSSGTSGTGPVPVRPRRWCWPGRSTP
jgi:MoxR-like ATPase